MLIPIVYILLGVTCVTVGVLWLVDALLVRPVEWRASAQNVLVDERVDAMSPEDFREYQHGRVRAERTAAYRRAMGRR